MSWVLLNGERVPEAEARIDATGQGALFGRGVFETFRAWAGRPVFRLADHIRRLEAGAGALGIPVPTLVGDAEHQVVSLLDVCGLEVARVRVTLWAGRKGGAPSLLVQAKPISEYPESMYRTGAVAVVARVRRNESSPLRGVKSVNYLDNLLAREEARAAGAVEALLLNTQGNVAEGSATNVFIVRAGKAVTPPLIDGALPGITREAVLALARSEGVEAEEASIAAQELRSADEAFVTNAVAGVLPVTEIDGARVGSGVPGEVTAALLASYRRAAGWPS